MATVGLSTYKPISSSSVQETSISDMKRIAKSAIAESKPDSVLKISDQSKELAQKMKDQKEAAKQGTTKKNLNPAEAVSKIHQKKFGNSQKPAIFFISGFDWLGASSVKGNYDGIRDMAEAVKGGEHYAWDEKEEMINAIKERKQEQPVILVGHSFGADTAIEIAQDLNSIDNGFRKIDLIITLDSVGFNNDFIPQNVKKNVNYLAQDNRLINDGPNIALNYERTQVYNFLRTEAHAQLDDATDIQINVLEEIQKIV